jgi:uncharacterized protein
MKIVLKDNRRHILRFDKDEEIISCLENYAQENKITAAQFSGIGTCSKLELGYFNPTLKDYRKKPFYDNLEIISLTGNMGIHEGKSVVHAHGSFGNNEFTLVGGHVFKIFVLATCEISVIVLDGQLERKNNPDTNLNLLV